MLARMRVAGIPVLALALAAAMGVGGVAAASADPERPVPAVRRAPPPAEPAAAGDPVTVGSLTLRPCRVVRRALCGHVDRPWEPGDPAAGTVRVGFAFVAARDATRPALSTLVPHEGGPGYSTTGTGPWYAAMYGSLLERRNLLLVDQRGTGRSQPIDCPDLQNLVIAYSVAAGRCGRSLGDRSDDYSTALSADDLAAVVDALGLGRLDLYGDSYGTFFAQVFAGRHPESIRSIALDGAYPTYGETGWYPTQGPAMTSSFRKACDRSPVCRRGGRAFVPTLEQVLRQVRRHPWQGTSFDGDGRRMRVHVTPESLVTVAYGATYTPAVYRSFTAALRSALTGDRAPLLRLVAQAEGGGTDAGPIAAYSEGLDAAVACHDYPQLYDMTATPATRLRQYRAALTRRIAQRPRTYGPFTVREYSRSSWQALDWCTRWPAAPAENPAGPPKPPAAYPDVPTLVLSGELDSITTPAEGALVARQFPRARHVVVANSFHVTALGDTDGCAVRMLRRFVAAPHRWPPDDCAATVPPVRSPGRFPVTLSGVRPGVGQGGPLGLRVAPGAAATVADLLDQWWSNYSGHSRGLRGGRWRYTGDRTTVLRLDGVRLVTDLAVSGRAEWHRYGRWVRVDLRVSARGRTGHLRGRWPTRAEGARATLRGAFAGERIVVRFPAP